MSLMLFDERVITLWMAFREAETGSWRKTQGKFIGNVNRSCRSWTRGIRTIFHDGELVVHLNEALDFRVEHWPHSIPRPLASWNSSWNSARPGGAYNKPNSTYLTGIPSLGLVAYGVVGVKSASNFYVHIAVILAISYSLRQMKMASFIREGINGHEIFAIVAPFRYFAARIANLILWHERMMTIYDVWKIEFILIKFLICDYKILVF